jgi:hypothetical protein
VFFTGQLYTLVHSFEQGKPRPRGGTTVLPKMLG